MNFFKNESWQPLSQEQKKKLLEWEKSADPTVRFQNNYYTLYRHQLIDDYLEARNIAAGEDEEQEAKNVLDYSLNLLRKDYLTDLDLMFEMQQTLNNVFLPWKVNVITPGLHATE